MAIAVEKEKVEERIRNYKAEMVDRVKSQRNLARPEDFKRREAKMPYRSGVKLSLERAKLVTESYKETDGEPIVLRRAKALAKVLDNMTIYIDVHSKFAGNYAPDSDSLITYPELFWSWLDKQIELGYKELLPDDEKRQELHEIHKYWKNKAVHGSERRLLPEDVLPYWFYTNHGAFFWLHGGRTGVPNYEKLFKVGLNGIIQEVKERLSHISSEPSFYVNAREYLKQKQFLEAAIIALEAGVRWGKRYVKLAREMAAKETDATKKQELEEIAQICDSVPGNPPRTLREALQCYWFITLIYRRIDIMQSGLGDRFDQIMYPFYKKEKEEGRITREQAEELVGFLFIKINEFGDLTPPGVGAASQGGVNTGGLIAIGGVDSYGQDATNEMTYIVLDARTEAGLTQPMVGVRLHRNTPQEFLYKLTESLCREAGIYAIYNDEMMIPYLVSLGIPLEDARNYGCEGCMRWIIPGKAMEFRALGGNFVLPRCFEFALSKGIDKISGKQIGYSTPDPATFASLEDVIKAYLEQVKFFMGKLTMIYNMVDVIEEKWLPRPFLSALMDGCIECGEDCRTYKYFLNTIFQPVGQVNVANSLAAIKKLVFDDKKVSMAELVDALKNNWEGKEELLQMCLNAPKFGNDDDYVDLLARDISLRTTEVFRSFKNIWGGPFLEDGTGASAYFAYSGLTGATPDGRKDRDLFCDGTVSPAVGTDTKGNTAVLKSAAKIDHVRTFTQLLNQKFLPQYLSDEYKEQFAAYLRTFVDFGIHHIQFNVVDRQTLSDAQEHPVQYKDLVVRVAGFSVYFIDLEKTVQNQIIARTEQGF